MKLATQVWAQLADVRSVRNPERRQRRHRASDGAGAPPDATTAPVLPLPRSRLLPLLALLAPALAVASCACWLHGPLAGAAVALALLLPLGLCLKRQTRALTAEADARRQLRQILGSLHEALFVIGRDLRLSAICSVSLHELLRVSAPAGRRFEDLLRPLLDDEASLAAALTFLQLLWSDQADECAIESLNPLAQVEVRFAGARGGGERRWLSFAFRRVAAAEPADDCIHAVVADVTDRVLLARELEQAQDEGDSQAELLLQLVRADPPALAAFLDDADTAFRKSNAILTGTGIGQPDLHKKLIAVMRELDAITAAAEALPFASFAQRLQGIDDVLAGLCARSSLTGNDFLPAIVRLDELILHAASMRSIYQHIVLLRAASAALAAPDGRESSTTPEPRVLEAS
jgi:two-component system, chemotaxis family, sensor kinase CheA